MQKVKVPKGKGQFRQIYVPSEKEKAHLRELVPVLAKMERARAEHFEVQHVAHGFINGRSPVTCAREHIGYEVTYSFDLASWFDSITQAQLINAGVEPGMAHAITEDGCLRQGLPTSPVAANLVAVEFDKRLIGHFQRTLGNVLQFVYTRYADDIIVSIKSKNVGTDMTHERWLLSTSNSITNAVDSMGWKIAQHKTHVQYAKAGRRIIVGLAVGDTDVHMTREVRRRIRAAKHHKNERQLKGLTEWAKCKLPRCARGNRRIAGVTPGSGYCEQKRPDVEQTIVSIPGRRITFGD